MEVDISLKVMLYKTIFNANFLCSIVLKINILAHGTIFNVSCGRFLSCFAKPSALLYEFLMLHLRLTHITYHCYNNRANYI